MDSRAALCAPTLSTLASRASSGVYVTLSARLSRRLIVHYASPPPLSAPGALSNERDLGGGNRTKRCSSGKKPLSAPKQPLARGASAHAALVPPLAARRAADGYLHCNSATARRWVPLAD